jgi:hypothetical protein
MKHQLSSTHQMSIENSLSISKYKFVLKKKLLLFCLSIMFALIGNAQNGQLCQLAINFPVSTNSNTCLNNQQETSGKIWYKFKATGAVMNFVITSNTSYRHRITNAKVYSGNCGNLQTETAYGTLIGDSVLNIYTDYLVAGQTYFLELDRNPVTCAGCNPIGSNYSICRLVLPPPTPSTVTACTTNTTNCEYISNGDFEQYFTCPSGPSQIADNNNTCFISTSTQGTPDLYATCASNINFSVPANQEACNKVGQVGANSYAGFGGWTQANNHEYVQLQLNKPLIAGETYQVSFWIALSDPSQFSVNGIGARFTTTPLAVAGTGVLGGNQLTNATSNQGGAWLNNRNWTQMIWTYTVPQGQCYNFITIGNFSNLAQNAPPNPTCNTVVGATDSYYFLDGVDIVKTGMPPITTNTLTTGCTDYTVSVNGANACNIPNYYTWSTGATGNQITGNTITSQDFTVTAQTQGCNVTSVATATINAIPLPPLSFTVNPQPACPNSNINIHVSGGTGTYTWTTGGIPIISHNANYSNIIVRPNNAGVYTFSCIAGNCSGSGTVTFTISPNPVFSVSPNPVTICKGQSTATLTASDPTLSYTWSPAGAGLSATSGSVVVANPSASISYQVIGTSTLTGCSSTQNVQVNVAGLPPLLVASPTICAGSTATLSVNSGNGALTFTVASSLQTQTFPVNSGILNYTTSPSTTTVYTITSAYFPSGCYTTKTATVTVVPLPLTGVIATPAVCAGQTNTLTAIGTATTYTWLPNGAHSQIDIVAPGAPTTYTVIGAGANGCTNTETITITPLPLPTITITATPTIVCVGSSTTLSATGASSYSWTPASTLNTNLGTPVVATPTVNPTTYTVKGVGANGCIGTATKVITIAPIPTVTITSPTHTICSGGSATLTANGTTNYTWSPAGNFATGSVTVVHPSTTTVYTVTGVSAAGCSSQATFTLHVTPTPTITITPSTNPVCIGTAVTLTACCASTYTWTSAFPISPNTHATVITTPVFAAAGSVNYSVHGTQNGCNANATITLTVVPNPVVPVISGTLCPNTNDILAITNTLSTNTYSWTPAASVNCGVSTPVCSQVSINNPTGTYTVTVTDIHGCKSHSTISTNVVPTVSITNTGAASYCSGSSHNVVLTGHGASTYTWNTGATSASITVQPTVTTTYTVTGTSAAGCAGNHAVFTITVTPSPTITVNSPTICIHNSATLTASGGNTYVWNPAAGNGTANPHTTIAYNTVGTFTNVSVIGTTNGCTTTTTATITVVPQPTLTVSPLTASICANSTVALHASGANTYTWTPASSLSSSTGANVNASPVTNTIYTVTGTTGCKATATVTITVSPSPTITVNNATICAGSTTTLTAHGGTTYSWTPATGLSATTGSVVTAHPTTTTHYTVTGTSANGCTSSVVATVSVNPTPTVAVNSATVCTGGTATLTASGATTYSWTPATGLNTTIGNSVTSHPATTTVYTITGTTGSCSGVTTSTVTIAPHPTITVNSATVCTGGTATLTANGASIYSWTPATGLSATTGNSVTSHPATTTVYTITGTSASGCSSLTTSTVTVNSTSTITVNSSTICAGGTATLTANGATTYSWTPAIGLSATTGNTVTSHPSTTTIYTVTGISGGCSAIVTSTVTVNSTPTITVNSATICVGTNAILNASGATTYTWTPATGLSATTGNTVSANPSVTTVYTITGSLSGGCFSTTSSTVTVNPNPTITVNSGTVCTGGTATLTASGATTYTWTPATGLSATTGNTVSANPSITTIYTVTGASSSGCSSFVTSTVTINPAPVVTVNSDAICIGASTTLNASGATTYSWIPAIGLSATTGSSVNANPSTTTIYTVTGTTSFGCTSFATSTVTVGTPPTLAITPSPNPICIGTSATLNASGASTYTWTGLGLTGSQGATVTTPNLTINTNYTVTGTSAEGCVATTTITVDVIPGSVTLTYSTTGNCSGGSGSTNTICSGESITITANSSTANSYTWNPGNLTGSSITVSPASTTVYTVNTSSGACNLTNTFTVNINPNCNCAGAPLPVSGSANNTVYSLANSFTITAGSSLTISSSTVNIAPTVSITVLPTATLTIDNSHLAACTSTMWQGIVVAPNGVVNVVNNSMIEDAVVAIDNGGQPLFITGQQITPASGPIPAVYGKPPIINVNGAIFNCNYTAIREAYYQSGTAADYGTNAFSINNVIITCRCGINPTQGITPNLNTYTNSVAGTANLSAPSIDDYYSIANYPSTTLKAPYLGQPAYEGIHLENDGVFHGHAGALNDYSVAIYNVGTLSTQQQPVIFDNLTYGINAINSTINVSNSVFQNSQAIDNASGYGINANQTIFDYYNGIYVDHSHFIDLVGGINNIGYYDMDINNNTLFSNQTTTPNEQPTSTALPLGDFGMYISPNRFISANMSSNNIANINTGIDFVIATASDNNNNGELVGPVTTNSNTVSDQFPTTTYPTAFVANAIILDNVIAAPNPTNLSFANPSGQGTEIQIQYNTINNAYRGILARNQQYQIVRDENNTVSMVLEPNASTTTQYGIEHTNVMYLSPTAQASSFPTITQNTVTGFLNSANTGGWSNQNAFEPKKGIWCDQTANNYVTCNTVSNAGRSFEFSGLNNFTFWRLNQMSNSGEGLALASSGIIGSQGANNDGSDNFWSGFSPNNPETFVDASSNANISPLYVKNSVGYIPVNSGLSGIPYIDNMPTSSSNIINSIIGSKTYNCGTTIAGRESNPTLSNTNTRNANNGQTTLSSPDSSTLSLMEKIVQDSLYYSSYSAQNNFINKNMVYRSIKQDTSQMNGSAILHNFYSASQTTCRQLFCVIEDSLNRGNYSYANTLVSGFNPSCTIEQNYKRFYQIFMNGMQNVATGADSSDLEALASSCPLLNGSVVYQARSFHNNWHKRFKHYEDNCPVNSTFGAGYRKESISKSAQVNQVPMLSIYPNPNNGKVYITGFNADEKTTGIEITDVTGKLVYKQQSNIDNSLVELNLPFVNGVYFVRIVKASGAAQIQKIIINN